MQKKCIHIRNTNPSKMHVLRDTHQHTLIHTPPVYLRFSIHAVYLSGAQVFEFESLLESGHARRTSAQGHRCPDKHTG